MTTNVPPFAAFYRDVHGREPFPWQNRLAALVADAGWPDEIGVPTGLGKTACIDIAVWALAHQSDRPPSQRTAPTRLWYVVNRRLLVDTAYHHGRRLVELLRTADGGVLADVAAALRRIGGLGDGYDPLHVVRLRGGAELGVRPPTPATPTLTFATVPMFASRWLFRGYGTSRLMRPVDAALAGIDTLVLLDEAHLAATLQRLQEPAAACDVGDPTRLLPAERARPRLVSLTATGDRSDRFVLDDADHGHPVVQQRVTAAKLVTLTETSSRRLSATLAETALDLVVGGSPAGDPLAAVVFVNTPDTAAEVAAALHDRLRQRRGHDADQPQEPVEIVVLTGRIRSREATQVRARLLDPARGVTAGDERLLDRPLLVVATQTLEVGADFDFDVLVSETAGVRALVQRLGRLNRLGLRPHARGVVVHPTDVKGGSWPVYGTEPALVWERLQEAAVDNSVQLSPDRVAGVLGEPADTPPRAGELLPVHLWEWAKTSLPPPGEAAPELFFAGIDPETARVSVCWRGWLPLPGERCLPIPSADEAVDVPIGAARTLMARVEPDQLRRLGTDGTTLEPVSGLRPGDTLLVDAAAGGYGPDLGFVPDAEGTVVDVSVISRHVLPLHPRVLGQITAALPEGQPAAALAPLTANRDHPDDDAAVTDEDRRQAHAAVVELLSRSEPASGITSDEWRELLEGFAAARLEVADDDTVIAIPRHRGQQLAHIASDAFDDLSFNATSASLTQHCGSVGAIARQFADAIGLPVAVADAVAHAGRWHDLGKADPRFQRWLAPDGAAEMVAKSTDGGRIQRGRASAGWPRGGRHELLSARLLDAWRAAAGELPDAELVAHLVASHHGHGRPSVPTVTDPLPVAVAITVDGTPVSLLADLSTGDWAQPRRFRQLSATYGYWGLALLEAVLRQADHAASSVADAARTDSVVEVA